MVLLGTTSLIVRATVSFCIKWMVKCAAHSTAWLQSSGEIMEVRAFGDYDAGTKKVMKYVIS